MIGQRKWTFLFGSMSLTVFLFLALKVTWGLDCFKCVSIDGDNPACEDPFHNNYTIDILESPCWTGRKHRNGLFPATACIKLSGKYGDTGETMIVRGCALDSGSLTIDTEIVRMSHCGGFYFDDRYVKGCLQSCTDDACNVGNPVKILKSFSMIVTMTTFLVFIRFCA
ncbi:uncharacterized protein LOC106465764 [Limulus polyphemus]|uniref:Uncharacterized protein LOC106465764 n=1 Tax=Limulus polyphemus TaxID=6850 RepID=A0ABM1T0J9_LIMPO|nr:uncharacterized protein LOC106465764 [Limulus polyphemus]XP_022249403.1 uncharacterized protein LOC106465764 [Limulus polyphemus]XP_022249404.1 uncharacterized protein LOC106465764 [Limulus polyphemus]XP_022249405.1 uncharacterized protein LOC106465764 [Limulus polyphemus]XP_022249406.1 uncharacterized protein LOC106465764 [Limulus polyphemus]XP_022249407.1 uncharacterized protein LOC106465764 [Limulus polyphemus]